MSDIKTLDDLTPEIEAQIPIWKEKCIKDLYDGTEWKNYKREDTALYINYVFKMVDLEEPVVVVANTLNEYREFYNRIFEPGKCELYQKQIEKFYETQRTVDEKIKFGIEFENMLRNQPFLPKEETAQPKFHWNTLISEYSRVYLTWYKFIKDMYNIPYTMAEELDWLYSMVNKSSIAKAYVCEGIVLILRLPEKIKRNDIGFHDTSSEGAISYPDQKLYYINGRNMPDWIFEKYFNKTLTFDDFINESNEDVKAGIITIIKDNEGNEGLLKFLNAVLVDEDYITHGNGQKEHVKLFKTKEKYEFLQDHKGNFNVPYAWTWMKCPSTGTEYLIDTSSAFDNVIDSMKFHRPEGVPQELSYVWDEFTN